jgi:hypothetical protein
MPNWCFNDCNIAGEDHELTRFLDLIGDDFHFERIIPTPPEVLDTAEWSWKNWGTNKVAFYADDPGVDVRREPNAITLRFDTAWSFPEPIFKRLAELFPTLTFNGHAEEPNAGLMYDFEAHDGELTVRHGLVVWADR